jgi:ankyrin repeat protein
MRALPDLAKVKLLVEHGADINGATNEGDTALIMSASIRSAEDTARYLVQGADVRASNQRPANRFPKRS